MAGNSASGLRFDERKLASTHIAGDHTSERGGSSALSQMDVATFILRCKKLSPAKDAHSAEEDHEQNCLS
jgi:hypothetical protein